MHVPKTCARRHAWLKIGTVTALRFELQLDKVFAPYEKSRKSEGFVKKNQANLSTEYVATNTDF